MQPHDKFALAMAIAAGGFLFFAAVNQVAWDDRRRNICIAAALIFGATGAAAWLGGHWAP
jgi:hypothetical protein